MTTTKKFNIGKVAITRNTVDVLDLEDVWHCLIRHASGDWGECTPADAAENELSLKEGFRVLSVYRDRDGVTFWVITEADRENTTVLLPCDY